MPFNLDGRRKMSDWKNFPNQTLPSRSKGNPQDLNEPPLPFDTDTCVPKDSRLGSQAKSF